MTSPESESKSSQPGFHFPYSYEDDDSGESCCDDSVEIVDTLPKGIYSLPKKPAPKSADIEIISSQKAQQGREKAREIYDLTKPTSATSISRGVDCVYPGSSQAHPIDLEGDRPPTQADSRVNHPATQAELIEDSDNEPPEILPISQASLKAMPTTRPYDPFRYYAPMVVVPSTNASVVPASKAQEENDKDAIVADSDADSSDHEVNYTSSDDELEPSSDIDSIGTSEKSWPNELSDDEQMSEMNDDARESAECLKDPAVTETTAKAKVHFAPEPAKSMQEDHVLIEDSQLRDHSHRRSSIGEILDVGSEAIAETNEGKAVPEQPWTQLAPRAPSPSDAALARPPHTASQHSGAATSNEMFDHFPVLSGVSPWHRLSIYGPKSTESGSLPWMTPYTDDSHTTAPMTNNNTFVYPDLDAMDRALPRYDDGPFSGWPYDAIPSNPYSTTRYGDSRTYCIPPHSSTHNQAVHVTDNNLVVNNPPSPRVFRHESAQSFRASMDSSLLSQRKKLHETSSVKPAKLPISDIVNQASDNNMDRSLKRKADEISSDEVEDLVLPEQVRQVAVTMQGSQDTLFPDAQPRDDVAMPDNTLHDTLQEPELSVRESDTTSATDGPPSKRAKTSRGASRPVRAFVSGVLVGCLSLAGACAAFIATIPENVRDEALREM